MTKFLIDWERFFGDYVIFGWYRFRTFDNFDSHSIHNGYSWGVYRFDLHMPQPWHKCYKVCYDISVVKYD